MGRRVPTDYAAAARPLGFQQTLDLQLPERGLHIRNGDIQLCRQRGDAGKFSAPAPLDQLGAQMRGGLFGHGKTA